MRWFPRKRQLIVPVDGVGNVLLRPLRPSDKDRAAEAYRRLSPESRLNRFWARWEELSDPMLERLIDPDGRDHVAWMATFPGREDFLGLGAASYWRLEKEPQSAEVGITIADEWQGRGLGTLLMAVLWQRAWSNGITRLIGYARLENGGAALWWKSLGGEVRIDPLQREMTLELSNPAQIDREGLPPGEANRDRLLTWLVQVEMALGKR